ncbi:hypothetical protein BUALT_Bualt13G0040800 [Buddleja alternifolia]|uniref:Uncharacterized protein n=1 Tax=Buddleja alternifolia TaxID=168488 RepID=A0AAV6WRB5_9LAMI|nr:hypothetical protein BUALT_Bualt13G0040800 [Buddleja alternifolia]
MSIIPPIFCLCIALSLTYTIISACDPCYIDQYITQSDQKFVQKSKIFYEFNEKSNTWVEVGLPYHLISCINDNCSIVGSIQEPINSKTEKVENQGDELERIPYAVLAVRKRVSLTKMSETSVWITGVSGSIYERFWNGLQWVIAPHDLPFFAGYAVSVFIVNQTILALSEPGILYQMQLTEDSQPIWIEFMPEFDKSTSKETDQSASSIQISSGLISNDRERLYFCTKNGLLLELLGVDPPWWTNHGRPPGADVAAITDAATIRPGLLFTVSAAGDLYEYDQTSKPPWKKHIHRQGSTKNDTSLAPLRACSLHGLVGAHSVSLFLLTKGGELFERRLHQRKWKWVVHGFPNGHTLTSITCVCQDEHNENSNSLFLTTAAGFVFEYHIQKYPGSSQDQDIEDNWQNHEHPPHAKVARGVAGLQFQPGRMIFPLDDGRLAELHLSGLGGENLGPYSPTSTRRKPLHKYVWSLLDTPETEGWNAEYCTDERGPSNCILGTKEETSEISTSRWRKDSRTQHNYLSFSYPDDGLSNPGEEYAFPDKWINKFFRLRLMQMGKSFFLITGNGLMFEYLNTENSWFWLRHGHTTGVEGALGNYNGSLFIVDADGSLLIRERSSSSDLAWINCTAMRKGRRVIGGPPWDGVPGQAPRAKAEDAIFFVSRSGRLLQFNVALRKFKWKDCKSPPSMKIASIVDQEGFRENIIFVVGQNGRLYQYNKVTQLWHQHHQSQHLVLSRSPGTAMRSSSTSSKGSLFMISEDGALVEYQWSSLEGWNWIEHGRPDSNVTLVGAPGPCFGGSELFLISSHGSVYLRFLDQGEWKWRDCGFPHMGYNVDEKDGNGESCMGKEFEDGFERFEEDFREINKNCDPKVSSTRPIPFSEDSIIFELQDGRLAEMRRMEDKNWIWSRTIGTPASLCMANFWTSLAS